MVWWVGEEYGFRSAYQLWLEKKYGKAMSTTVELEELVKEVEEIIKVAEQDWVEDVLRD